MIDVLTHSGSWLLDRPGVYTIRCTCGWAHTEGTRYQRGNQAEALARFRLHEKGVAA